jgi:hypothetical protein
LNRGVHILGPKRLGRNVFGPKYLTYVRGSFKLGLYSKLRKKKRKEFKQKILNQLDDLECNNPKEYWSLVNQLRNEKENYKNGIEGDIF